jgi:GTPase
MEAEQEDGNVEYKLRLLGKSEDRIKNLATQMRFRADEGSGECIYELGVTDNGDLTGMTPADFEETIDTLSKAAEMNNYSITLITDTPVGKDKKIYEILIREKNDNKYIDVKVAIAGSVDSGKCLKEDTEIRLYSGDVKKVQYITTYDVLMGDDSTPRRVLNTTNGKGQLYCITNTNGDSMTVNKNHVLCLKAGDCNSIYWNKRKETYDVTTLIFKNNQPQLINTSFAANLEFTKEAAHETAEKYLSNILTHDDTIQHEDIVQITLENYVNLGTKEQCALNAYRTHVNYPDQMTDLDPYLFGYWLGDRNSTVNDLTITDAEILGYFTCTVKECGLKVDNNDEYRYTISSNKQGCNHFVNSLAKYNVLNGNKHIPDVYKYNSRKNRLAIIAGLIDSDGYRHLSGYELKFNNEKLCDDIIEVIISLGFESYKTNTCNNSHTPGNCVSLTINGISELPCFLKNNKIHESKSPRNPLFSRIKNITPVGEQQYFGFELDGNQRYLHKDFTVTHNSSLIGVLTSGRKDDGRGSARLSVFNYVHEVKSGRTSSIAHHILGFDETGGIVNHMMGNKPTWPSIVSGSAKIISFIDLAGHQSYLKTTILGLSSSSPDLCMIIVGANRGVIKMTREHILLCVSLNIPFAIVVTKIDMTKDCPNVLKETIDSINKILKCPGVRRIPIKVETKDDVVLAAKNVKTESVAPVFQISNVTGEGVDNLQDFLNLLGKRQPPPLTKEVEYHIDSTFQVHGVGTVCGGYLVSGVVNVGDKLMFGPNNGEYEKITIKSIHCKRVPLQSVKCGSYVCLCLKKVSRENIRKGNVLVSPTSPTILCSKFEANVQILRCHSTTIRVGYEPIVHVNSIRQSVKLIGIKNKICARNKRNEKTDDELLRTGDRAIATFEFMVQPEYIKPGMKILLAEGMTKLIGEVV